MAVLCQTLALLFFRISELKKHCGLVLQPKQVVYQHVAEQMIELKRPF